MLDHITFHNIFLSTNHIQNIDSLIQPIYFHPLIFIILKNNLQIFLEDYSKNLLLFNNY